SSLLPSERRLAGLRDLEATHAAHLETLAGDGELAAAEAESLKVVVHDLERAVAAADLAAREMSGAETAVAGLHPAVTAHATLAALLVDRDTVGAEYAGARAQSVDLREQLLDLRERRIAGMAAELAGGLAVGDDCPVCGSSDHPHPARAIETQPD